MTYRTMALSIIGLAGLASCSLADIYPAKSFRNTLGDKVVEFARTEDKNGYLIEAVLSVTPGKGPSEDYIDTNGDGRLDEASILIGGEKIFISSLDPLNRRAFADKRIQWMDYLQMIKGFPGKLTDTIYKKRDSPVRLIEESASRRE